MNKLHYFLSILTTFSLTFSLYATEKKNSNINSSKQTNNNFFTINNLKKSIPEEDDEYVFVDDTPLPHFSKVEKHDGIVTKNRVGSTLLRPLSHYFVSEKKKSLFSRMFKNKKEKLVTKLDNSNLTIPKKEEIFNQETQQNKLSDIKKKEKSLKNPQNRDVSITKNKTISSPNNSHSQEKNPLSQLEQPNTANIKKNKHPFKEPQSKQLAITKNKTISSPNNSHNQEKNPLSQLEQLNTTNIKKNKPPFKEPQNKHLAITKNKTISPPNNSHNQEKNPLSQLNQPNIANIKKKAESPVETHEKSFHQQSNNDNSTKKTSKKPNLQQPINCIKSIKIKKDSPVNALSYSPCRKILAFIDNYSLHTFSYNGNIYIPIKTFQVNMGMNLIGTYHLTNLVFSPNTPFLVLTDNFGSLYVYFTNNNINYQLIRTYKKDIGQLRNLTFSPNGKYLACTGMHNLYIYSNTINQNVGLDYIFTDTINQKINNLKSIAFSSDSNILALTNGSRVWTYNIKKNCQEKTIYKNGIFIQKVAFSYDNKVLAWGDCQKVYIHKILSKQLLKTLSCPGNQFKDLTYSSDQKYLAIAWDKKIELYETTHYKQINTVDKVGTTTLAFSPDSKHLASTNKDNSVQIWNF